MGDSETRFRLTLHYDGSAFHGWQIQPEDRTVQGELEKVFKELTGSRRVVEGSGRTDAGVHAIGQVASVTMPASWTAPALKRSVNALLPDGIWAEEVAVADPDFHPRFDAQARTYRYLVGTDAASQSPFHKSWCWPLAQPLDEEILHRCARALVGPGSFEAFAKAGQPERGYDCRIDEAEWTRWKLGMAFTITANRYLHHMVRYLVGTMVELARGKRPFVEWEALLRHAPGLETSPPAPPEGLFLAHVAYESTSEDATPTQVPEGLS
ncbi:MAG: tRNA pseudouridine(38-40) synthase TruA [Longimicrobiales bacterium]